MISTLLNYRLYTNNMARTLDQLSQQAVVERNSQYYDDNIGKVTSVDAFLDDYKLYSYAMKAYGLEDQIGAKGLMRKVLESDLTDPSSFANKLVDKRYQAFATAFDFNSASKEPTAQSAAQTDRLVEAYGERVDRSAVAAAAETNYFEDTIGSITTTAQLVGNRRLLNVALKAVGIADPQSIDASYVKSVLDDPQKATNAAFTDLRARVYASLDPAQRADVVSNLIDDYNTNTGNATSPQAAQANVEYFTAKAGQLTAKALTEDSRLLSFALTSVGFIVTSYTPTYVEDILTGKTNVANLQISAADRDKFTKLKTMLGFDGTGAAHTLVPANETVLTDGYLANHKNKITSDDRLATNSFKVALADIGSVTDLMARENGSVSGKRRSLEYVLKAFDIDPATASLSKIRAVLTSDPSDPGSYVSKLKDPRYSELAAAFNFGSDGKPRAERLAQSIPNQTQTATLYSASFGTDQSEPRKALVKADTQAYLEAVGGISSLDEFLADKTVVAYALKAYGVEDTDISARDLRKIMTSDLADPESFANAQGDKAIAKFAAAFNFEPDGSIADAGTGVQAGAARLTTDNLYLLQTLEQQAGETSEGTRLALYFLRTAPEIKTSYQVLADKAVFEVVRTALGLPEGITSLPIEGQAKLLDAKLDFSTFADPKALDKFIGRFAAMYDLNSTDASSSPILALFNSTGTINDITSLL